MFLQKLQNILELHILLEQIKSLKTLNCMNQEVITEIIFPNTPKFLLKIYNNSIVIICNNQPLTRAR